MALGLAGPGSRVHRLPNGSSSKSRGYKAQYTTVIRTVLFFLVQATKRQGHYRVHTVIGKYLLLLRSGRVSKFVNTDNCISCVLRAVTPGFGNIILRITFEYIIKTVGGFFSEFKFVLLSFRVQGEPGYPIVSTT